MAGKYIYGIIGNNEETTLNIRGVDNSRPVHLIAYQDLGGVVSDYSGREFSSLSKEEVVRSLLAHQMVVEQVMKEHTVLPVKFGTVLASSSEVHDLLGGGYSQFVEALALLQDKGEVEVAATWDTRAVLQEVGKEEAMVRLREAIASKPGQPTVEERIRLGQAVKAVLDKRRESYQERMIEFLKPMSLDVQPNVLVSDELVMNVAFLVERAREEEFDCRVRELNDLFHNQIDFRVIGPLPPYSFATVEVTRLSEEKIREAKQLLHLGDIISEPEVRRAYRRLAAQTHPDHKPGDKLAGLEWAKLRQAVDLLIAYCRGQAKWGSLLVNIRRVRTDEIPYFAGLPGV